MMPADANAMYQSWQHGAKRPGRAALWVFPPFPSIAAVINELLLEQVNAVLILLRFMLFWYAMLQRLSVHVVASLKFITVQTVHHWVWGSGVNAGAGQGPAHLSAECLQ